MKKQITTVSLDGLLVITSWANSELRFQEFRLGNLAKECVIKINTPWDVKYIRARLDELEAYWKKQLAELAVPS